VKLGDLVRYDNDFWVVIRFDPMRTRTALLLRRNGSNREIPHAEPVEVLANPSQDWPFVAAPLKPQWGPVVALQNPTLAGARTLELYQDWLPSEPARSGGSLFLNPSLNLRHGDYLLAEHGNGQRSRIVIPAGFGTVRQKQAREAAKTKPKPEEPTAYTRLLEDDRFEDE
jgi:hypothetical protein